MPTPSPAPFKCPACGSLIVPPPDEMVQELFGESMGTGVVLFKGACKCKRKFTSRFLVDGKEADKGLSIDK